MQRCVERENEMHRITFTTPEVKEKILHLYRAAEHKDSREQKEFRKEPVLAAKKAATDSDTGKDIKDQLARIISRRIQLAEDQLDEAVNFKDLGVDSISGVEIVRDINELFGLHMDSIDIYDYPTIQLLSAYIGSKRMPEKSGAETQAAPESKEERDLLELLARMNEDELDVNEVAQFLEVYYG